MVKENKYLYIIIYCNQFGVEQIHRCDVDEMRDKLKEIPPHIVTVDIELYCGDNVYHEPLNTIGWQ